MSPMAIGLIGLLVLMILMFLRMPVGFAMAFLGFAGFSFLVSPKAAGSILASDLVGTFASYDYSVITLFVLMGQIAFHTKISERSFGTAYKWLGKYPGGLAMAAVGACGLFAAICGSSPATAATMGSVALPELRKKKYSMPLATGAIAAGGTLGILIPPSVVFIVYGILTEQSIVRLFAAGIIPGIILTSLFIITIYIIAKHNVQAAPRGPTFDILTKLKSLGGLLEVLVLFLLVVGGLFAGWFSPTEAGGIGTGGVIVISLLRRQLTLDRLWVSLFETTRTAAMLLIILSGAMVMGKFFTITQIPMNIADWVAALPLSRYLILIAILVVYLILGCVMEIFSVMIITVPIFFPVIESLGFDPIWFGVVMTIMVEMGAITPPVGINTYVVSGLAPDVPIAVIFRGIMPFLLAMIVCLIIIIIFPGLALFLPRRI